MFKRLRTASLTGFLLAFPFSVRAQGATAHAIPVPRQNRARVILETFDSVKADLSRLGELEKAYYKRNQTFTVDTATLSFKPASATQVRISYASTRAWAASATHPVIEPFVCFMMVTSVNADSWPEKPFCRDSRRGTATAAIVKAGAATEAATPPKKAPPRPSGGG